MHEVMLPDRHPEGDFFIADIFDAVPVKCDRHTMEHPFFTLSTKPDMRVLTYRKGDVYIQCRPAAELGLPTMMDKDILLYVGSLMMREINEGRTPPKTVRFSCHDLLVTTNRDTSGDGYSLLKKAFDRITGCLITTDIKTGRTKAHEAFHILDNFRVIESSHKKSRMVKAEVTVSEWFYRALLSREVLTLNREYFRLRKPIERRLYELARKHCGKQPQWQIGLENLKEKCGSLSELRKFRTHLRDIIKAHDQAEEKERSEFPDYVMSFDADRDVVTFHHRAAILKAVLEQSLSYASASSTPPRPSVREQLAYSAFLKARQAVEDAGTGWDLGTLIDQFNDALEKGFQPRTLNGAFLGFVRTKVQKRP